MSKWFWHFFCNKKGIVNCCCFLSLLGRSFIFVTDKAHELKIIVYIVIEGNFFNIFWIGQELKYLSGMILLNYFLIILVLELKAKLLKLLIFLIVSEKTDWAYFLIAQLKVYFDFIVKLRIDFILFFYSQKNFLAVVCGWKLQQKH